MAQEIVTESARLTEVMRSWGAAHPYSTLDIFLGASPGHHDKRFPRPGVCFTLNTAFASHLQRSGVPSSVHLAGVQDQDSPDAADVGSHLTVIAQVDGQPHLTDVGLGCGPLTPIPLLPGTHGFNGFDFPLTTHDRDGQRWWRLGIPSALSRAFRAMEFCEVPDDPRAGARAAHFLAPTTSPLRDVLLIQGWVGEHLVTAHGPTVTVRSSEGVSSRTVFEDPSAWRAAIQGWFPDTFGDADLGAAWARLEALRA